MRHVWPAIFALIALAMSTAAVACEPSADGPIKSFTAERSKITKGQTAKLTAVFEGGSGMIDNGIGEVMSGVAVETPVLMGDTTFSFTVVAESGETASQALPIAALDPAVIASFKPENVILPGQSTNLIAVFSGGTGVIDNGIGPVISGVPVSTGVLQATKNFTLTVTNEAGDPVTMVTEVEAAVTPVITSFGAPGAVVPRYAPTTLNAVFTGGKGVVDQNVGAIVSGTPTPSKDVPAAGATFKLTVTNGLGESVSKTVSVTTKKELFVTDNVQDILVFDIDATGDVQPKRIIVTEIEFMGTLGLGIVGDEIFISNETAHPSLTAYNLVDGFRPPYSNGGGDTKAKRRIAGPLTTMVAPATGPQQFAFANGEIFVADKSSTIKVWNVTDTGDVAPKRTISGPATGLNNCLGVWIDNNELYVGNFNNAAEGTITVYPTTATGNATPTRTITGADQVTGMTTSGNELFAVTKLGEIIVFNKMTGAQLRKIVGMDTQTKELYQCSVNDAELFCSSYSVDRVVVFPANGNGDVMPTRTIMGDKTYIASPTGAYVF